MGAAANWISLAHDCAAMGGDAGQLRRSTVAQRIFGLSWELGLSYFAIGVIGIG